jgi:hypothetical protein
MAINDVAALEVTTRSCEHMVRAINDAVAEKEPFPHFVVRGLFPADIYHEMLALLPSPEHHEECFADNHSYQGVINRARFKFTNACLQRLAGRQRSLWLGVRDAIASIEFKNAVFAKLRAGLAFRFGVSEDDAAGVDGYAHPLLYRETAHYTIAPHPDTRRKVVTMQIALPTDGSQENLGTEFYRRSFHPRSFLREPRGFEIAKRPPFLPNSAYAFVVLNKLTLKSWHGRTALADSAGVRNSILNIWYASAADTNPDIARHQQLAKAA